MCPCTTHTYKSHATWWLSYTCVHVIHMWHAHDTLYTWVLHTFMYAICTACTHVIPCTHGYHMCKICATFIHVVCIWYPCGMHTMGITCLQHANMLCACVTMQLAMGITCTCFLHGYHNHTKCCTNWIYLVVRIVCKTCSLNRLYQDLFWILLGNLLVVLVIISTYIFVFVFCYKLVV